MNKNRTMNYLCLLIMITLTLVSCGPTTDQAIDYNDKIIDQQTAINDKEILLINALGDENSTPESMQKALKEFDTQIATSTTVLKALDKFDDSTVFADAALKLFAFYDGVAKNEYKQVVEIYSKADYTDEELDLADKLLDAIDEKLDAELNLFQAAQDQFAAKYHFEIEKEKDK